MAKKKRYVYKVACASGNYPRLRKKVRKTIKFLFFFAGVFLIYFGGRKLLEIAYKSDKILIKNIEVLGAKNVTKSEIKELLPFNIGDNLLKVNLSKAEEGIKKLKPELKNITINRRWQKIRVRLYERTPEAFVMCDDNMVGIDFDNTPFALRGFMSTMKVPEIICKSLSQREDILKFIERFKPVCGVFIDNISEVKLSNTGDIIFAMRNNTGDTNNTTVFWGEEPPEHLAGTKHLASKFEKFQKVYVDAMAKYKQIEYIDMTLYDSGRIIVKPIVN
jgi:cell division protein FtsQ